MVSVLKNYQSSILFGLCAPSAYSEHLSQMMVWDTVGLLDVQQQYPNNNSIY